MRRDFQAVSSSGLKVTSPQGTTSTLAELHVSGSGSDYANGWTFGIERLIGEDAQGAAGISPGLVRMSVMIRE